MKNLDKYIVITGAAGFIGSNLLLIFNKMEFYKIIIVDDIRKINISSNLSELKYENALDYNTDTKEMEKKLNNYDIEAIFHIGANTNVLDNDLESMMQTNFYKSIFWLNLSIKLNCTLVYASTSAIYGNSNNCSVDIQNSYPLNEYALSKSLFDQYLLFRIQNSKINNKIIGFRFFNVFGPGEEHKNENSSIPFRFFSFLVNDGFIELFDDLIQRDYVFVTDVVKILFLSMEKNIKNGIYNLGSGVVISHESIAKMVLSQFKKYYSGQRSDKYHINKVDMPIHLRNKFQFYTKAENVEPWIQKETKLTFEKMEKYVFNLLKNFNNN